LLRGSKSHPQYERVSVSFAEAVVGNFDEQVESTTKARPFESTAIAFALDR
jgi:hypothetical protein